MAETLGVAVWSSLKSPFDQLLQKLTLYADEVDKAANAEHMRSNIRTQQRILSSKSRSSGPSPLPPSPTIFSVPNLLSRHFTAREIYLSRLHSCLVDSADRSRPRRAALWGLPGVGKSQVAFRYAQDTSSRYRNVFYIRADSKVQMLSDLRAMAMLLSLIDQDQAPSDLDAEERFVADAVKTWLGNNTSWLLIFDNVCDPRALLQVLPVVGTGDILFTTRDCDAAQSLADTEAQFEVTPLGPDQVVQLVGKLLHPVKLETDMANSARELHQLVDGLPIAIEQTVTLARLRGDRLGVMVQRLRSRRQAIMDQGYQSSLHEIHSSTGALFAMATESLTARNPEAAALFKVLIYLDTSAIPTELLKEGSSTLPQHFARGVAYDRGAIRSAKEEQLRAAGALRLGNVDSKDFLFHALRHPWKRSRDLRTFLNLSRSSEDTSRPDSAYDLSLQKHVTEERYLRSVLEKTNRIDHALLELQNAGLIRVYNARTIWIHDLVRDLNIEMLSSESKTLHQANSHLAMTLVYLAFPVPSLPYCSAAFKKCILYQPHAFSVLHHCEDFMFDTTVGPELMHIAASMLDVQKQGNPDGIEKNARYWYDAAYKGYVRCWVRQRQQYHVSDAVVALEARQDFDRELRGASYTRTIRNYERFGQAPRRALDTALKLGHLASCEGDHAEAKKWLQLVVKGYSGLLGEEHEMVFDAQRYLVNIHIELGAFHDALGVALKRLLFYRCIFGPLDTSTEGAGCAAHLGFLYRKLGRSDVALEWYQQALASQERTYGLHDTSLNHTLVLLAETCSDLRQWQTGLDYALRAQELLLKECEERDERLASARCRIALCLEGLGNRDEAVASLRKAIRPILPPDKTYEYVPDFKGAIVLLIVWNLARLRLVHQSTDQGDFLDGIDRNLIEEAERVHGVARHHFETFIELMQD
jgi:tetratricopeptide (TPR) repeat protein